MELPHIEQKVVKREPLPENANSLGDKGEMLTVECTTQTDRQEFSDTYETPVWTTKAFTEKSSGRSVTYTKNESVRLRDIYTNQIYEGTVLVIRNNTIDLELSEPASEAGQFVMLYPSQAERLD